MELVYAWVNGAKFVDICSMTKEFEVSASGGPLHASLRTPLPPANALATCTHPTRVLIRVRLRVRVCVRACVCVQGTIIRVIRRLEELCRQLGDAAKAIGDEGLEKRFREASAKMRRDIIFAASLYL